MPGSSKPPAPPQKFKINHFFLAFVSRVSSTRFWLLAAGFWLLAAGFWLFSCDKILLNFFV
jgi:hypothetical protein